MKFTLSWLKDHLDTTATTPDVVKAWLGHLVLGSVSRFDVPGLGAFNFLLEEALDGGGPTSLRTDPMGKGMAQQLLEIEIDIPRSRETVVR